MKRGTFVLTPFPFTDLTSNKVRPALVVSRSDRGGNDVILAFATSFKGQATIATDLLVDSSHQQFSMTGLKAASIIKLDKLATIDIDILLGELGDLPSSLLSFLDDKLRHALEL